MPKRSLAGTHIENSRLEFEIAESVEGLFVAMDQAN